MNNNSLFNKPFIIAEIGANHNGDMDLAKKLIDSAKLSGADAVKFQSWGIDSIESELNYYNNINYNDKKKHFGSLYQMVEAYQLSYEDHVILSEYCSKIGIIFSSTPFTTQEVDLLVDLEVPFFKVASMDINNLRLLKYIAKTGKPIILSTGMSTLSEMINSVSFLKSNGATQIVLMHCVSLYPTNNNLVNLKNITLLKDVFSDLVIGFSDHTLGISAALGAVSLGALVIEKHFTIDNDMPGWDHKISSNPVEFYQLVNNIKNLHEQLGSRERIISDEEREKRKSFRRSAFTTRNITKGELINEEDIVYRRPGGYIGPDEEVYLVGRRIKNPLSKGELIKWDDLE